MGDVLEAAARFLDRYAAGRPVSKDRARILASRLREVGEVPSPCEDCGHNRGPSPLGPPYVICGAAGASHDPAAGCGAWTDRRCCLGPAMREPTTCTRCGESCFDYRKRGPEEVCILCVSEELASAERDRDEARGAHQRLLAQSSKAVKVAEEAESWWRGKLESDELERRLRALLGAGAPIHSYSPCPDCPLP